MAIGISYEGDGFIRGTPAGAVKPSAPGVEAVKATLSAGEAQTNLPLEIASVEARARAMRREYLSEWLCRLFDRWN